MTEATKTSSETAVAVAGSGSRPHEVIAINQPQLELAHAQMLEWVSKARASTFAEEQCNQTLAEKASESATFDDLGLDSLDKIEIVMTSETQWGIEISDEEVEPLKTISDLADLVERKVRKQ
jgi:acyl carrier protein